MSLTRPIAYLDHNLLDSISKGDPHDVVGLLKREGITVAFSTENLAEIQRSTGFEQSFLETLEQISAWHLVPILDDQFRPTGHAELRHENPFDTFQRHLKNPPTPNVLSDFLHKIYDGQKERSFEAILEGDAEKLKSLLMRALEGIDNVPGMDDQLRSEIEKAIFALPSLLKEQTAGMTTALDRLPLSATKQFDAITGLGPKVLNNIQKPDVVRKIWTLLQENNSGVSIDIDLFFGVKYSPFESSRDKTKIEKVNAIYNQLNFIGYYRDSSMSKERRFRASLSDMTHAGLASFCHLFLCRDKNLMMKAAAAYEYLNINTRILYYKD